MPWLSKEFAFTERLCLKASASFTNMLNRPNLADDFDHVKLNIASSGFGASGGFGQPSAARGSDFAGSRTGQVSCAWIFDRPTR